MQRKTCLHVLCITFLLLLPTVAGRAQNPIPAPIFPPPGFVTPPADVPCILPGNRLDLQCFVKNDPDAQRIRAEEAALFQQALTAAQSGTLDPAHQVRTLGELEIFDPSLSVNGNIACSYCHDPAAGYANGSSVLSIYTGGSNPGSVPITVSGAYPDNRIAKRNPQSYVYAPYFPPLHYNVTQGDFYGGNFWDARASGYLLQNSSAEQAQDPPVDPEEMANEDTACIVWHLSQSQYASFFETVWGTGALSGISFPSNTAQLCSIPKGSVNPPAQLLPLSATERTLANQAFNEFGQAIAAYEISNEVSPFTSRFDAYLAGLTTLTSQELNGYNLFRGKANCNSCHLDGRSNTSGLW
jgi:cytochrome c peroxidase